MTGPDPVSIARRKQVTVPRRLRRFLALDDFEGAARRLLLPLVQSDDPAR